MDAKEFAAKIDNVRQRVASLMQRASGLPEQHPKLLEEVFAELNNALEELAAAEHELDQQHTWLEASNQQLQAERLRYENLFEFVPDAYLMTDLGWNIQEANKATEVLLNVRLTSLIDRPLVQFFAPQDMPVFAHALRQAHERGQSGRYDLRVRQFGGTVVHVVLKGRAIRGHSGELIGLVWLLHDSTEHRRFLEAKLQEQHTLLQTVIENIPDAVYMKDLQGRYVFIN